jgi:chromosome partitioning protein
MSVENKQTKIISISSQKGGTGKSTSSINIASGLVKIYKKKVLLIDIDPQANSSKILLPNYEQLSQTETICSTILRKEPLAIHQTKYKGLEIVPSHLLLSSADIELAGAIDLRADRLKNQLDEIKHNYDYIIIDCPPSLSWLFINALTTSTDVVVMVDVGYFSLDAIKQILKTIDEIRTYYNKTLNLLGFLYTMTDSTRASKDTYEVLKKSYPTLLLPTHIPRNTDIRDAQLRKMDIWEFNPESNSAHSYKKIISYIEGNEN